MSTATKSGALLRDAATVAPITPPVGPLGEAVHEHHRDGRAPQLPQSLHALADGVLVEGQHHVALVVESFRDGDAAAATGDLERGRVRRIPDLLLVHAPHLDLVAVA